MLESYQNVGSPRVNYLPSRPGLRLVDTPANGSADQLSTSGATKSRLPLPALPANYDGPILLVTTAAIRPDPIVNPIGAPQMLKAVATRNIPIVYLPSDDKSMDMSAYPASVQVSREDAETANRQSGQTGLSGYMQALRTQFPAAQLHLLAGNKGDDARLAATPGLQSYLRNTDPYQTDMPKGFKGILTDEYFENFQTRLIQDLFNSRQASVSCGGSPALRGVRPFVPVYPNPPALQKTSGLLKLGRLSRGVAGAATDIIGMVASSVEQKARSTSGSLELARGPQRELAASTPVELGKIARDILDCNFNDLEKSQLLYKVVTSKGTDGGHIDSILSCMQNPKAVDRALQGQELWAWTSHRKDATPKVGDWSNFEAYMDGLTGTPARAGNKVHVLLNGQESFDAQLEAIRNAKEFINFTTFAFASDQFARHFLSELEAAANRGVRIDIIKDKKGSEYTYQTLTTDPNLLEKLKQYSNVQYIETPDSPLFSHLNHRKIMMTDNGKGDGGQIGFIGGMNIANDYRIRWHDLHSQVEGPCLTDMNRMFISQIRSYGGHIDAETEARLLRPQTSHQDGISARIVGHVGLQDHDIKYAYLRAINTAEKSIDIADPYLSDPEILGALRKRAEDGVKVRIFIPRYNDKKYLKWAIQAHYKTLIKAGVELYEYQGHEMAHEKVGVFDNKTTTLGSSNLDARSLSNNEEANLWSTDEGLAHEVTRRLFDADVPNSHRITEYEADRLQTALNEAAIWAEPLL